MTKTKSQSHFRNSFNSEEVDTDALSECSTNPSIENNGILDQTNQTTNDTTSTLDGTTDKDTHGSDGVNEDTVTVDKEPEEPLKGSEINGEEKEQDIENNEDECVEKGMKFFLTANSRRRPSLETSIFPLSFQVVREPLPFAYHEIFLSDSFKCYFQI